MAERSKNWENERYLYEKLKQTQIFRQWKKAQFDCQVGKCAWCEKPMQYRYTETDHVKPLYYGGNSEAKNLVLCHHKCNKEKSTSVVHERPEWIKKNGFDEAITKKYHELALSISQEDNNKFNSLKTSNDELALNISQENSIEPDTLENNIKPNCLKTSNRSKVPILIGLFLLVLFITFPSLLINTRSSIINTRDTTSTTQNQNSTIEEENKKRKDIAQSILEAYTKYYEYWVLEKGYDLPPDADECTTWNGCNLSFPLGTAETPEGYTYSINSLDDGLILSQTGQSPHASTNNVALYKKARCNSNNTVVGGIEDKNAASIIQLSNGEYYCIQN